QYGDVIESRELIDRVLDHGSWESWDVAVSQDPADPAYQATLDRARRVTGLDEAVLTGSGTIAGHRVAVVASAFEFLAGSVGVAASRRIRNAIVRATAERLPLVASPASGGTRLQEGTLAFVQMARISAALAGHRAAGLPYLVYLRHPTTGGVLASWGSLGQVTAAEPGALIGLLGPRVQRTLYGEPLPSDVQSAENLFAHGLIDAVVAPEDLRDVAGRVLTVLAARPDATGDTQHGPVPDEGAAMVASGPAWESVIRSRRADRPGVRALLKVAASDVTPLSGTGAGERDEALILALARFGTASCVVLGQDRRAPEAGESLGPAGLREAIRGMRLAADLDLPLVTVIDTPGAVPTRESEEGGLAGGIARCLSDLVSLPAPTVCVLLGQGGGGTALALLPADRVLCAQHAWLAPLPLEAAAEVLYRKADRAPDAAADQGINAAALLSDGIVDRVIPELPDAADEPEPFLRRLGAALETEIAALRRLDRVTRLAVRAIRY
ncbi:MAG TPA: carboxyl transferase domain-containing protein, partial [Jiangellaceae bacterium]|nr:carboxyl transferase domain-containing protein [Jiangellaceae bacterium]